MIVQLCPITVAYLFRDGIYSQTSTADTIHLLLILWPVLLDEASVFYKTDLKRKI